MNHPAKAAATERPISRYSVRPGPDSPAVASFSIEFAKTVLARPSRAQLGLALASARTLRVKPRPVIKRFLGPHSSCRKAGVKVGALNRFLLRQTLAKEGGKAANKSVAGSGAVHALHAKRGHVLHAFFSGKQRAVRTQSDDHPPNATGKKLRRAAFGVVEIAHRHAGNRLCLALIGNKVVEIRDRDRKSGV